MRVIVVGIVSNAQGEYLICKMPEGRGVFPGKWGLPGGGIEEGESIEVALRRELQEELAIEITNIRPLFFTDGKHQKSFADGSRREIYMIFLILSCTYARGDLTLSPEFCEYAWTRPDSLLNYDLNSATVETFHRAGIIKT